MAKYIKFTAAIETLKRQMRTIGGKDYTINEQWLQHPKKYPSYSENSLQAIWNIAETLLKATQATSSTFFLTKNYFAFKNWFAYMETGTGILKITDEKTYALGQAWQAFLTITTQDPEARSMLTSTGIEHLQNILDGINERLKQYDLRQAAEHALINYKQSINTSLSTPLSILPLPEVINNDDGTLSYQIDLSTLDNQAQQQEADKHSYEILIEQLKVFLRQLATQTKDIAEQHDYFNDLYPFPPEAAALQSRFLAIREQACVQLLDRQKDIEKLHLQVSELIDKAKKAQEIIIKALNQGSEENRKEIIQLATATEAAAEARAKESLNHYLLEKTTLEEMPLTNTQTLGELEKIAAKRRNELTQANTELDSIKSTMLAPIPVIPSLTIFNALLIDASATATTIQQLKEGHEQAEQAAALIAQKAGQKPTFGDSFKKWFQGTPKASPQTDPISRLILVVAHKQQQIQDELKIDITQLPATTDPVTPLSPESLGGLQKQYHSEQQLSVVKEAKKASLAFSELQSRQDSLAYRQALLNRGLTQLELGIADIQPLERSLTKLLDELTVMEPDAALGCLDENSDQLTQLQAWFEDKPQNEQRSYKEINASTEPSFSAQKDEWHVLNDLYKKITSPIPADMLERKGTLQHEYEAIGHRISVVNAHFEALQQLVEKFAAQKEAAQVKKLTTIINSNKVLLDKITDADKLSTSEKNQLIADLKQQLRYLTSTRTASFFATMELHKQAEIAEKIAQITADQDALFRFMKALHTSTQLKTGSSQNTDLGLLQLENTFFGPTQNNVGGIFGDYLRERANTFWIRDLWGRFASLVFGCFSYKSTAEARRDYIANLREHIVQYQTNPDAYGSLIRLVEKGQRDFKPRAMSGENYECSLNAKLSTFKKSLEKHEQTLNEESDEEDTISFSY